MVKLPRFGIAILYGAVFNRKGKGQVINKPSKSAIYALVALVICLAIIYFLKVRHTGASGNAESEQSARGELAPPVAVERPPVLPADAGGLQQAASDAQSQIEQEEPQEAPAEEEQPEPETTTVIAPQTPLLKRMADTTIPVEQRQKELEVLAKRADTAAFDALKEIAEERIYLRYTAAEVMGAFGRSPERGRVGEFLAERLCDDDSQMAMAAVRGYGKLLGAEALPALSASLITNRERPDGHDEILNTITVKMLKDICDPAAVPALVAELERSELLGWSLEYGSQVVAALRVMPTEAGRKGATAYAERLEARIPDDKMAGDYYREKIAEARAMAEQKE